MTEDDILAQLREIVAVNFEIAPERLEAGAALRADLGLDSLELVDLTFFIKRAFGIQKPPGAYRGLETLGDVAAFVRAHAPES